jgi:hypothetical protein
MSPHSGKWAQTPPTRSDHGPQCLDRRGEAGSDGEATIGEVDEEVLDEPERVYRCRACKAEITRPAAEIAVAGKHVHLFNNPAGLVFRIGCFGQASGARWSGEFTLEATWFAAHPWRYAHCAGCGRHIGWQYTGDTAFWGLILGCLE